VKRCGIGLAAMMICVSAHAIERIHITAAQVSMDDAAMENIDARLILSADDKAFLTLDADRIQPPERIAQQTGSVEQLRFRCIDMVIREPHVGCGRLAVSVNASQLPPLAFDGSFTLQTDSGNLRLTGAGPRLADQRLDMDVSVTGAQIDAALTLPATPLPTLLTFFAPWFELPEGANLAGDAALSVNFTTGPGSTHANIDLRVSGVDFQNPEATWIAEDLALDLNADIDLTQQPLAWQARIAGDTGQFLGGPVLLDLARNPLAVEAQGAFDGQTLTVSRFDSHQQDLARAQGDALLTIAPFSLTHARVELETLQFPDAYTSYLQLVLVTTPFNQLTTSGHLSGALTIADGLPVQADLLVNGFAFSDESRNLNVTGVDADVHWAADQTGPPRPSWLSWESAQGWGIEGAASRVDFAAHDSDFQLLQPARLPLFDGALIIQRLAVEHAGETQMTGEFAATIEPIDMHPVSRALGLPEFSGTLSGVIPGLRYHDEIMELDGIIEAEVFGGVVIARQLSISQPLSRFPQLRADVLARQLDLQTLTEVFDFGNITGRIDMDLTGLETYGTRPTRFDFSFHNSPGDRTKRRISQRAVENLSNFGGGGGGVAAALQSGALKFFDSFNYKAIGLSCQLRNDVCLMDGVGQARKGGFYVVRGRGLPRIDIIGNQNRVDWPRLVSQIAQAISNSGGIVVN
jgi:hypothetical protein